MRGGGEVPEVPAAGRAISPKAPSLTTARRTVKPRVVKPASNGASGGLEERVRCMAALAEPFTTADVARAGKLDKKTATYLVTEAKRKGMLKSEGWGKISRSSSFPGAKAPASSNGRLTIPGLDKESLSLEQQLEKALKDRDEALARGNDKLAAILQDKVDQLQAKIES